MLGLVLLARVLRAWRERHGGSVRVSYPSGRSVQVPIGFSILEASKSARVPHASICGGRGRCSTCRVRIVAGGASLAAPSAGEQAVLRRIGARPGVRLACQTRPRRDVSVAPLLPPDWPVTALRGGEWPMPGEERFVAVMIVDMRNSTGLAETRLPFDAVFIVDRFVSAVGLAVDASGGRVSHFLGDGLMATFGLDCGPPDACRRALSALAAIGANVEALNRAMRGETPIRFGIGVHCGPAVVGGIGYGARRIFTTLGDAANVAARLEGLCKSFSCEAVVSSDVFRTALVPPAGLPAHVATVRGRSARLEVHAIERVSQFRGRTQADQVTT